jgi:hypothetical protein
MNRPNPTIDVYKLCQDPSDKLIQHRSTETLLRKTDTTVKTLSFKVLFYLRQIYQYNFHSGYIYIGGKTRLATLPTTPAALNTLPHAPTTGRGRTQIIQPPDLEH